MSDDKPHLYVRRIESELGIAVAGKTRVNMVILDMCFRIGVGIHGLHQIGAPIQVVVDFAPGWQDAAIAALRERLARA
jgi:hypothetical protein